MSHRRAAADLRAPDPAHLSWSRTTGSPQRRAVARACLSAVLVGAAVAMPPGPAMWICVMGAAALGVSPSGRILPLGLGAGLALGLPWPAPAATAVLAWGAGQVFGSAGNLRASLLGALRPHRGHASEGAVVRYLAAAGVGVVAGVVTIKMSADHLQAEPLLIEHQRPVLALVAAAVLVLAMANSAAEELLWRVALWPRLQSSYWIPGLIATQALSFGLAHGHGIPGGAVGMAAAGLYSAALAAVLLRWGLRETLTAHLLTDLIIFGWVAQHAIYLPT
jgi:membrane protease YdiL (CAAX protease family)